MKIFFKHSRRGSALLIGLVVTTLLSVLVIGFLNKVLHVGRNTKAIEQSTQAYYLATGVIETQLRVTRELKNQPWTITGVANNFTSYSGQKLEVYTGSTSIPKPGNGNSPFGNTNYNIISLDKPVQIVIPEGITWGNARFEFRVPVIDGRSGSLNTASQSGVILWTVGNSQKVLFASGGTIGSTGLFTIPELNTSSRIATKQGYFYSNTGGRMNRNFQLFYANELGDSCRNYKCTLKLSMLQPMKTLYAGAQRDTPFLEYRITGLSKSIPEQFMLLKATGKVSNYQRTRDVFLPQITTNTALDFAVLQ